MLLMLNAAAAVKGARKRGDLKGVRFISELFLSGSGVRARSIPGGAAHRPTWAAAAALHEVCHGT
jgi:hypothetical protein